LEQGREAKELNGWSLLEAGLRQLEMEPSEEQMWQFYRYAELLQEWNKRINLTAISGLEGIIIKHYLDSLLFWKEVEPGSDRGMCDVGSGAGFPGLPLKIMFPAMRVVLLEATGKKVKFLEKVINELRLKEITAVNARAEEYGRVNGVREGFDVVITRAVGALSIIGELCMPLLKMGGTMIGLKGPGAKEEAHSEAGALIRLGAGDLRIVGASLPFLMEPRFCFVVKKSAPTPAAYPRRPGIPEKRPLRP